MAVGMKIVVDTEGITGIVSLAKTRSITLKGVRAGIKLLVGPAKAAAPRRKGSGALKYSQGYNAKKGRKGKTLSYGVQGARRQYEKTIKVGGRQIVARPRNYDHLVQGGTQPHSLKRGSRVAQSRVGRFVQRIFGPSRNHPGTKPNPYRKRAYEANKAAMGKATNDAMAAEIRKAIDKEAGKFRSRGVVIDFGPAKA